MGSVEKSATTLKCVAKGNVWTHPVMRDTVANATRSAATEVHVSMGYAAMLIKELYWCFSGSNN